MDHESTRIIEHRVCVHLAGTLLGMILRRMLSERHLTAESKDVVRLGTGVIGTPRPSTWA
jgi:hypothetical protein